MRLRKCVRSRFAQKDFRTAQKGESNMKHRRLPYMPALPLLLLCCSLAACTAAPPAGQTELIVFAAASMTETLEEIAALYEDAAPGVKLVFNFDSSGTLKTQIREGAECDLFISAGQKQMDQLDAAADAAGNPEQLDFVLSGSRIDLLENRIVLCVPAGNPKGIAGFADLAARLPEENILLAMGNSDVPAGQYAQGILAWYQLDEAAPVLAGRITYGTSVKEVAAQVRESSVDCGVIYCTDASGAGLTVVDSATPEMCGRVVYPAAITKNSKNAETAEAFLAFLQSEEAMAVFEKAGFAPAP